MNMKINDEYAVNVYDLGKKFEDFVAVNRISFEVKKGEVFGFLGPNGAGKTTTIKMLCGILSPTSGSGKVAGYDITRQQEQIKQHIGYMSQKFSLYDDLTVEENIDFYGGIYKIPKEKKRERKDWIIRMGDLESFRAQLTKTLPVGYKQRLALGCAIMHEPKIIFLDEPTSGVDPIARKRFWSLIREMAKNGVTSFITTHYMDEAGNCDRLALIYRGCVIALGTPQELKTAYMKNDVLEITLSDAQEWIEKLKSLDVVKETALFGSMLHMVVADAETAIPLIKMFFEKEKIKEFGIKKIEASLEDVFVSLIESYDDERR